MKKSFLLNSETSKKLYEKVKALPIVDYHNHLSFEDIKEGKRYLDICDLWVKPDPYKHRAMRMCGVEEHYITGSASNKEKFVAWCKTVPKILGNPLHHWTKMELALFGISKMPNEENAEEIYDLCNKFLAENKVTPMYFAGKFNIEMACPCASVTDDVVSLGITEKFIPSLRGDDIVSPDILFIKELELLSSKKITNLAEYQSVLKERIEVFKKTGCKFSDHALDNGFKFYEDDGGNGKRFENLLNGTITQNEKEKLCSYLLVFLGAEYEKNGLVMQLHIGAQRFTSTSLKNIAGPAGGFAAIGNSVDVTSITKLLDSIEQKGRLPKIMLFTLNPADNAIISVISGSYSKNGVKGLITQGPAWWCDHKRGIWDMLENAAVFSAISNFVGMTTDSRSFMSLVRHDYFRRILCDFLGEKFEIGEFGDDFELVEDLAIKMCYKNAKCIMGG